MKLFLITRILDNAIIKTTGSLVNCKVMTISNHFSFNFPFILKIVPYVFVGFVLIKMVLWPSKSI